MSKKRKDILVVMKLIKMRNQNTLQKSKILMIQR